MKLIIDIPQGMIDAFSHEAQWTAVLCKDMNNVLQNGIPYEERKGKWIKESEETGALGIKYTWVKCSECGWSNSLVIPKNYCPNCGANMVADLCSICKHGDNCERSDKGINFANHSSCWKFER